MVCFSLHIFPCRLLTLGLYIIVLNCIYCKVTFLSLGTLRIILKVCWLLCFCVRGSLMIKFKIWLGSCLLWKYPEHWLKVNRKAYFLEIMLRREPSVQGFWINILLYIQKSWNRIFCWKLKIIFYVFWLLFTLFSYTSNCCLTWSTWWVRRPWSGMFLFRVSIFSGLLITSSLSLRSCF